MDFGRCLIVLLLLLLASTSIAADEPAAAPQWIWTPQRGTTGRLVFEKSFHVDAAPQQAELHIAGDFCSVAVTLNGEQVTFIGRLRGGWVPAAGKLVEVQFFARGRWRTFATTRAATNGRWRYEYRFDGTRGTVRWRFRARIPREVGYPFTPGTSRAVAVTVHGL